MGSYNNWVWGVDAKIKLPPQAKEFMEKCLPQIERYHLWEQISCRIVKKLMWCSPYDTRFRTVQNRVVQALEEYYIESAAGAADNH